MSDNGTQAGPISAAVGSMLGRGLGASTSRQSVLGAGVIICGERFTAEGLAALEGQRVDVRYSVPLGDTVLVQTDDGQSIVCERVESNLASDYRALDALRPKPETIDYTVDRMSDRVSVRGTKLYVGDVAVPHLSVSRLEHNLYSVVCDRRFEKLWTAADLEEFGYFLGQCMAVAAGYTCIGENSRPKQRNLFAPLFPAALAPQPGEPDRRLGLLRAVLSEAENNPGHVLSEDLLEGIVHELDVAGPAVAAAAPSAAPAVELDTDVTTIHADITPAELIVYGLLTMHAPAPLHIDYLKDAVHLGERAEDDLIKWAVGKLVERGLAVSDGELVLLAGGES